MVNWTKPFLPMNALLNVCAVYSSSAAVRRVGPDQLDLCVELHRRLDWGYADERTCADNDYHLTREAGEVVSLFHTARGHRVVVTSDLDRQLTLVRLTDEA
jgi:hypothetical protein